MVSLYFSMAMLPLYFPDVQYNLYYGKTFIQGKCCGDLKPSHEELQSSPISGVEADIGSKSIEILTDIRSRNRYLVKINLPARGHWPIRSFPPDEVFSGDLLWEMFWTWHMQTCRHSNPIFQRDPVVQVVHGERVCTVDCFSSQDWDRECLDPKDMFIALLVTSRHRGQTFQSNPI